MNLLYLEDDPQDVELVQMLFQQDTPDCKITAVMTRDGFVAALRDGSYDGILSDSGVFDLPGAEAVKLARGLAPGVPYVFLCGMMSEERHMALLAAKPDGLFSKDNPDHVSQALRLLRERTRRKKT